MKKKLFLELKSVVIRLLTAVALGVLLLSLVYCIPTDRIDWNLVKSAGPYSSEGTYPVLYDWCNSKLDNYTDSLMMMNAAYQDDSPAIVQALSSKRGYVNGAGDPYQVLLAHYVEGKELDGTTSYMRYWHGYLTVLKPLLYLTTYQNIRVINAIVQCALVLLIAALMFKKRMKRFILPFMIMIGMMAPMVIAKSLQFSTCYYISLIGCIAILNDGRNGKTENHFLFLYLGIATAYFDFLTYPIATLGIPAVLYYCKQNCGRLKKCFVSYVQICGSWCFGYGGMWSSKWLVASVLTGENVLVNALENVKRRSTHNEMEIWGKIIENPPKTSYVFNRDAFMNTPMADILKLFVVLALIFLLIAILTRRVTWKNVCCAVPFLGSMVLPIIWYMLTANHSIIHSFFTNKGLAASAFAIMCMIVKCFDAEELQPESTVVEQLSN